MHFGRAGHKHKVCWDYKKEKERQKDNSKNIDITSKTKSKREDALIANTPPESETALLCTEICKDVWILDAGASNHMRNTLQGIYNQYKISSKVKIGSRKYVDADIMDEV